MALPRQNFFIAEVPAGVSVKAIIAATEAVVGVKQIYCLHDIGGSKYLLGLKSASAVRKYREAGGLSLGGEVIPVVPAISDEVNTSVTCWSLPTFVDDEEIVRALTPHGKVLKIEAARYGDKRSFLTGPRYIELRMKINNPLPFSMHIIGHRVTFHYPEWRQDGGRGSRQSGSQDGGGEAAAANDATAQAK